MKKIGRLLQIILLITLITQGIQAQYVYIINQLKQKNSQEFPLVDSYDLKGGAMTGSSRTALSSQRRVRGQFFMDSDDDKVYQLIGGIADGNWQELGVWKRTGTTLNYGDGYVGINVATPLYPLHVTGDINCTDNYLINGMYTIRRSNQDLYIGNSGNPPAASNAYNFYMGDLAGSATTTGKHNVLVGHYAGYGLTSGQQNVCFGYKSLWRATDDDTIVAIGAYSMQTTTGGSGTLIGIGRQSGEAAGANKHNSIWIGHNSGSGSSQIYIGHGFTGGNDFDFRMDYKASASPPYVWGNMKLPNRYFYFPYTKVMIQDTLLLVADSLHTDTTYVFNDGTDTQIKGDISSSQSIKIGYKNPLTVNNSTGQVTFNNTLISNYSLSIPSDSSYRIDKQKFITRGYNASGPNYAFGIGALANAGWSKWTHNIFIGENSGSLIAAGTTTEGNLAIGNESMTSISSAGYNIAIGGYALNDATTAYDNIAIGWRSMDGIGAGIVTGDENTCVGYHTFRTATTGSYNTYLGHQAGEFGVLGNYNVAVGGNALNLGGINNNTAVGYQAGNVCAGNNNTFLGYHSGYVSGNTDQNTYLGANAGSDNNGSGNVFIGYNVGSSIATVGVSDSLMIDNSNTTRPLIGGDFATNTLTIWGSLNFSDKTAVSSQDTILFREGNKIKYGITDPIEDNNITWTGNHTFNNQINIGGLNVKSYSGDLSDDATITFTTSVAGWGTISGGDNEEWSQFRFSSDGTVTLVNNTANVANSDSDTDLCVYDGGSGIIIKNRLGATKKIRYEIWYSAQ